MWKPEHRIAAAARRGLRYPSDMSDAEWALVEPMIPPGRRGGRPRGVNLREVLNAIFYVLATGCQWQALPKDLPPKSTAHHYFALWDWDGTLERIHEALYVATREAAGRRTSPTAAIIHMSRTELLRRVGGAPSPCWRRQAHDPASAWRSEVNNRRASRRRREARLATRLLIRRR